MRYESSKSPKNKGSKGETLEDSGCRERRNSELDKKAYKRRKIKVILYTNTIQVLTVNWCFYRMIFFQLI